MNKPNMNDYTEPFPKPSLGARPYWVVFPERYSQLCEAIKNSDDPDYIMIWAKEIALLAEAEKELNKVRKERFI